MSTPNRVLTVIASGPEQRLVLADGNTFLQDAHKRLSPLAARAPSAFYLATAQNLLHIRIKLAELAAGASPLVLQIVGHGRPGELELGRSWPQAGRPCSSCIIENNSRLLTLLAPSNGPRLAEVRLVACNVGDQEGYPLLFALAHVFDCDVVGALGYVEASMLDAATGLYNGPMTRLVRDRLEFRKTPGKVGVVRALARSFSPSLQVPALTFEALRYSRTLAQLDAAPLHMSLSQADGRALTKLCHPIAPMPEGSSVVEMAFGAQMKLPGKSTVAATFEVMSNQRGRLVLAGESKPLPYRWDVSGFRGAAAVEAIVGRAQQTWREGFLSRAS